jgi:anionic cell wall polymer biosynthesis LytR-Cps2A-Psr (LCP) family protein
MALKNILLNKNNIILYILVVFIIGSAVYFYLQGRSNPLSEAFMRDQQAAILFVVYDKERPLLNSVLLYNNTTKRGAIFDIPGNVGYIFTQLGRVDRIDSAFNADKPARYLNVVQQLLGLEKEPFYFFFSLEEIAFWVDLMNGLEIFIANPIFKETENGIISLPAGSVVLDGNTAVQFLQLKDDLESANSWTERRHKFMQAFISKLSRSSSLLKNRYVKPYLQHETDTNIQNDALTVLWDEFALFDSDNLSRKNIAGATRLVSDQRLLFPYYEGRIIKETVAQTLSLLKNTQSIAADIWLRKIEIKNGTPRNGLAAQAQRKFESMGFSVSGIGNAPTADVMYTVVLDLSGNIESARRVADVIRCSRVYTVAQTDENSDESLADVQVILGRDFDGQYVRQVSFDGE